MPEDLKHYEVIWRIDIWAHNPKLAAVKARKAQNENTDALFFEVTDTDTGIMKEIDLHPNKREE